MNPLRRIERGNAAVEYALLLPVLIVILCGAVDFSRAFFAYITIASTAHEAAIFAARQPGAVVSPAALQTVVAGESGGFVRIITTPGGSGNTTVSGPTLEGSDEQVAKVTLTYLFQPLVPVPLSGPLPISAIASAPTGGAGMAPTPPAAPTSPTGGTPCTVPNVIGQRFNTASTQWTDATFTGSFTRSSGNGNFTIGTQSIPAGQIRPCTSAMSVSP